MSHYKSESDFGPGVGIGVHVFRLESNSVFLKCSGAGSGFKVKSTSSGSSANKKNNGEMKIIQCVSFLENIVPDCGTRIAQFMLKGHLMFAISETNRYHA